MNHPESRIRVLRKRLGSLKEKPQKGRYEGIHLHVPAAISQICHLGLLKAQPEALLLLCTAK